ncbi:MAG: hypothetical protein ACI9TH_000052 [Kiritimatiellia bacterium]|jgi:hypothetical protein
MKMKLLMPFLIGALACVTSLPAQQPFAAPAANRSGVALETIDATSYTYIHLDTGTQKIWLAGPKTPVKKGERVTTPVGFLMKDFQSPSLKRKFAEIYFVSQIRVGDGAAAPQALPPGHPPLGGGPGADAAKALSAHHGGAAKPGAVVDFSGLKKADKTVAEIFAEADKLKGSSVKLRGKVVKVTVGVLNRNWLHVRDGSGEPGTNDLTVTSESDAPIGSTVLVEGTIVTDQDFSMGYKYPVLMEKSSITVE